ncbi:hypothetical protein AZ78_1314 [Lysobacter capsici AZ78]|uniref:Lipoprotein n=1 Tax=Lysobacter capsici AZ78 TaxID=1444315 RepID=A0A108U734_9GAMM|nr:hypothetical protein [Lysobacter capsici]KWS03765.1 hypothetical protein AZ78_1314 [Lysobacter capsici AZ78]
MLTRIVALATTLLILTACTQEAPKANVATPGETTILDLADDSPAKPPNILEQVAEAEKRNEGGLNARLQAQRKEREKAKAATH